MLLRQHCHTVENDIHETENDSRVHSLILSLQSHYSSKLRTIDAALSNRAGVNRFLVVENARLSRSVPLPLQGVDSGHLQFTIADAAR